MEHGIWRNLVLGLLVLLGPSGCGPAPSGPWSLRAGQGLQHAGQIEDMEALVVLRSQVGLRLGSFLREQDLDPGGDYRNTTALIGRTTDGGRTWTRQLLGAGRFVAACRVGQQVYAVNLETDKMEDSAHVFRSRVYCSSDEGRSWQPRGVVVGLVTSVVFPSEEHGYALVNSGGKQSRRMVLQTADGGQTWSATPHSLAEATRGIATPQGAAAFLLTSPRSPVYATHLTYFGGGGKRPDGKRCPAFAPIMSAATPRAISGFWPMIRRGRSACLSATSSRASTPWCTGLRSVERGRWPTGCRW